MHSQDIRNFSIIAHIDHGKTTLTDQLLRKTNTITERNMTERVMDSNPIEKERGITIKLAPVRMLYQDHELNLIDTPGHVDFGYEVSRSLAACEGALLVVDATQGIQAQTLSNYEKARALGLKILPVINKIDLPAADPDQVGLDLIEEFGIDEGDIIRVSAKTGINIEGLLQAIIEKIPTPVGKDTDPLQVLVFTSLYHQHKGVIAYVRVVSGTLRKEKLHSMGTGSEFVPIELGTFAPEMTPVGELHAGEVGYIASGLKDVRLLRVGDTVTTPNSGAVQLPGYKEPQPMVYMEFYPIDGDDFSLLVDAMGKLALHDAALQYQSTHSHALGNGLRVGFLGILHAAIVQERLEREFDISLIATSPSVLYKISLITGKEIEIHTPTEYPDPAQIKEIREPVVLATIFTPKDYLGAVMRLCEAHRATLDGMNDHGKRVKVSYLLPLSELIVNFHDELKSVSSGFASLEYEVFDYQPVDAVKLDVLVHFEKVEALSQIVVREAAEGIGRRLV
ncbi:MAG TPA: translation elongation factor 4, partial [Patescibacteria group bacterium]|nr:translation elongation factor 4 [Patescibacteria group bacterium]